MINNKDLAFYLFRLTERNRDLNADHLNKSHAPNAKELCTGKVDFASVISEIDNNKSLAAQRGNLKPILDHNTSTVHVSKSPREASVDLSQSYLVNLAMMRLLNHNIKQEKAVVDGFSPGK